MRIIWDHLVRAFRNFNVENRAFRVLDRPKPTPAPQYPTARPAKPPEIQHEIQKKDNRLLALLKNVYVDSKDPPMEVKVEGEGLPCKEEEYRLTKLGRYSALDIHRVPKGKISTVELLTFLNNHRLHPETWTAEKIAEEYSLDLKDVTSLLKYLAVFNMEIPSSEDKKYIKST
ncbi:NADH dehydrogenase [ubiquinone] 1 alpha subcomplex assembly factor 4 [Alligator mississippiensis]|uniref:NADH dehydrogenase [ubiquinone] 1 alpha subcomplex assembly factor 4 n=1 Tax=Alligator mississippiensis TaxID=8496 RepID=A0A151NT59_ALLMI|nr:NADH dehydrogenase [ubiquinone] 1 alpha subcomplex assembly factor 4 [Alligator mississippiensis]KYO40061.1 NADH dehydrogenase [ubiquinone] 1 alpha subcomplex assembly factor 4 [Alligator mississippiensis]